MKLTTVVFVLLVVFVVFSESARKKKISRKRCGTNCVTCLSNAKTLEYRCSHCKDGYHLVRRPTSGHVICALNYQGSDACASSPCQNGGTCVDIINGYSCVCQAGYSGNLCVKDVDECLMNNGGCSPDAKCSNTYGSFTCTCNSGFAGNGLVCTDIDECLVNNGGCSQNAGCNNTVGSFICTCKAGFTGPGIYCLDIDECQVNHGGCDPNAVCNNSFGSFMCACNCGFTGNGSVCTGLAPRDCADVQAGGANSSGVYTVYAGETECSLHAVSVYCDMTTEEGGWTVFQRRQDGSEDFYRNWADYADGFGNISREFWLGNDNLYALTRTKQYKLRVDLADVNNYMAYAEYDNFRVGPSTDKYSLVSLGTYNGNAGNALRSLLGLQFTTYDQDNDDYYYGFFDKVYNVNCAVDRKGGWWYNWCRTTDFSNLNGFYYGAVDTGEQDGVIWGPFSLIFTEMKIRPNNV